MRKLEKWKGTMEAWEKSQPTLKENKKCQKCENTFPLENFHRHKGFKDGRRVICKTCSCAISRKYYSNNRDQHLESCRKWQKNNRDKVVAYQKEFREKQKIAGKKWVINNPERYKAHKKLNYAVFKGEVVKSSSCQVCGCSNKKIEAHHYDYTKSLEVIWVCTGCHGWIHRKRPPKQENKKLVSV